MATSNAVSGGICSIVLTFVVGCGQATNSVGEPTGSTRSAVEAIEFDGRTWQPGEVVRSTGDVWRPSMVAREYSAGSPDERLLEFTLRPNQAKPSDGVFERILRIQIRRNGEWISHGRTADWDLDGSRGESEYFEGELHGTQRAWHKNGQLHIERQFAFGKESGRDRGWYANGKPMYDSIRADGKELSGQSWDENGNPN